MDAPQQLWNTASYARNGRFVAEHATAVVDLLAAQPGEDILDIGCGDGALTAALVQTGANLTGIDSSPAMIEAARARGLHILHRSAVDLAADPALHHRFDAAFSNAALHWIPSADQPTALAGIARTLRPGGRFVAEMGGAGNIASIRTALRSTLHPLGLDSEALSSSTFPSPALYRSLLEAAGFRVRTLDLIPRPTALPGEAEGMHLWLTTFRTGVLAAVPASQRDAVLSSTIDLLRPILFDPGASSTPNTPGRPPLWTADYVRLRFRCTLA